jgi:hypothetical protein
MIIGGGDRSGERRMVDSMEPGKRLREWLRHPAESPGERPLPEYLPELSTVEWLDTAACGADRDVSASEFALVVLAVARDGDLAMRAVTADALGMAEAGWLLALDEALRQRWWWASRWSQTLAAQLAEAEVDLLRLVAAGCHHSGQIREAAVVHLANRADPVAAAVLALRCCDWGPQVRDRARAAMDRRLSSPPHGPALASTAATAFAVRGRPAGLWLAERVERILQDLAPASLEPLLTVRDRATRRAAYRCAIAAARLRLDRLLSAAVRDGDLPIRTMCVLATIRAAVGTAPVRALLSSRTALVRATAQAPARRAGADPAGFYRRLVQQAAPAPGTSP